MRTAATVTALALHALEMRPGRLEAVPASLPPADGMARQALQIPIRAVLDQRLEGVRVLGQVPSPVLFGMTGAAGGFAAIAGPVEQDGILDTERLANLHGEDGLDARILPGSASIGNFSSCRRTNACATAGSASPLTPRKAAFAARASA